MLKYTPVLSALSVSLRKNATYKSVSKIKVNVDLIDKSLKSLSNKLKLSTNPPCSKCKGFGYIDCKNCDSGCWMCNNTTLVECPYCGGTGKVDNYKLNALY